MALIDAKYMSKHMSLGSHLKSIGRLDYLWLASFALGITPAPGWSGFNQLVTESQSQSNVFHVSNVVVLPFINFSRSDMSTIYTALMFAQKEASLFNGSHCIVTFDQPLFIKTVDIVDASAELCYSVIVRLGGLHMTFSYMGSDGYIMSGSGQEQMWSTAYAEGSIPQMVSGHSYSRALCVHILSVQAIASVLLSAPGVLDQVDTVAIHRTWYDLLHEDIALKDALSTNQGSISGRPYPGPRDRESTKTWSNNQAMDSALWSCDHTPPFHPGWADRRLGPSQYACAGDVAHMPRCWSPPICKVSSAVPSGDGAPRGASTCRWFWEVHQPRILHYPPD